jgi:hypothetical protein
MKKLGLLLLMIAFLSACGNKKQNVSPQGDKTSDTTSTKAAVPKVIEETVAPFGYTPVKPQNGKLKGVVELGATGFNSFIINLDPEKNWQLEKAEFGASGVYEDRTSEAVVLKNLKAYIKGMIDFGVKGSNIHFVVSSSAKDEEAVKTIIAALKKINYVVNTVTAEQEGAYALKSALPREYESKAFVVDMGSGNTKISWINDGKVDALETYGSKYKSKDVSDPDAFQSVSEIAKQVPQAHRETCFIIGGVPFQMAKSHRVEKERYTALKSEKAYTSEKFQDDKSLAGLNIYKAIRETGCKTFVFDWDANFTIGFLLTIPY